MALQTNNDINSNQVATLLAVVNQTTNGLVELENVLDTEPPLQGDDARIPLAATLLNACARLDTILSDNSRWTLPEVDGQTAYLGVSHQQEQALALANSLKRYELFAAELNKRRALFAATEPAPTRTHGKRKKR